MLRIYPLSEKKTLVPICAYWSYSTWYTFRSVPFSAVLNEYNRRANLRYYPYSYIALWDDFPVGMVSLKESELQRREANSPWLSALYVAPEFRKRGIGTNLIKTVIDDCSNKKASKIFLFLDSRNLNDLEQYYTKRGWSFYDSDIDSDGNRTKILIYKLK